MPDNGAGAGTNAAFRLFVERLGAGPRGGLLLDQLKRGHEPDDDGWCWHPVHTLTSHPEHHPCSTTQLVAAIRDARL